MPHKPSNRANNNVGSSHNSMGYSPNQYPHAPYPNYMNGQGPPPVQGYAPLNYPSHPHGHAPQPPPRYQQVQPGYPMPHQPYYDNNPNPNRYPPASTIPNHGNPNMNPNMNMNSNTNTNTNINNTNKKTTSSHQADEEAAASALLMSAGGKPREDRKSVV